MQGSQDAAFKQPLKALIVEVCEREVAPETVTDDEPLFGRDAPLQLDSLDGLQLSMAIERRYGVKVTDSKQVRRIFTSVNTLADFLQPQ